VENPQTGVATLNMNRPTTSHRSGPFSRNDAVAATRGCDAPSQKVGATPSSRDQAGAPFGWAADSGDEASPAPAATGASQLRATPRRFSTAWFQLSLLLAALVVAGCKSFGPGNFTTPTVTGRVLAADTRQPLAGVKVIRVVPGQGVNTGTPAHGAQLLQQGPPETTGADGSFVIAGQSYVTLFRHASWWSVKLAFQSPGYDLLQTNFSTANVTNDDGTPVVNAGDILLQPSLK
jgi:hypothetical protein